MKLGDKKTLLIAGGVAAVAIVALVVVLMGGGKQAGCDDLAGRRRRAQGGPTAGPATLTSAPGVPGSPAAAARPGGGLPAQGPPGQTPGVPPPMPGQAAAAPTPTPVPGKLWASIRVGSGEYTAVTRPDPLEFLQPPPIPIPPEQLIPIPTVNLQQGGLRPGGEEEAPTAGMVANRRVAGVKFNGGAWAILESDNDTFVVKPGDVVDGTTINSISREAIFITDPQGQRWMVPLSAAGTGTGATLISTQRVSGMPKGPTQY